MNYRFTSLALAGVLSLGLLSGCGGSTPAPTATPSAPLVSQSPVPIPTESLHPTETPAPEVTPSATPEQEPSATPSAKPTQKPSTAPTSKPTAKPTQKPSATPAPTAKPTPAPSVSAVQSVWNEIAKNELPGLTDLDADTLNSVYGIKSSDLDSYICKMPLINVSATEFFIAKVKDGKMDAVKKAVKARQASLEEQWKQYLPEQLELVQNYKLVTNGNYLLFVVSEYADSAVTAFNTYTK